MANMEIIRFINYLNELGVRVVRKNDRLVVEGKTEVLNAELVEEIRSKKHLLLEVLGESAEGADIPVANRNSGRISWPLSYSQQRLWFLDQLEKGQSHYNIPAAVRLKGQLDKKALERTLSEVVRRHESLRTTFGLEEGQAVQRIGAVAEVALPITDLSGLSQAQREEQAEAEVKAEAGQCFDLSAGPLLRARLLKLGETEHILLLTMHHIVSDGWSAQVLIRETSALYSAYAQGQASPLEELRVQYVDYAQWQREWLSGAVLEEQLRYWKRQLEDAPNILALPTDKPRPSVPSRRGAVRHFSISQATTEKLQALNKTKHTTLFMTLTAVLSILLSRYANQNDISIGVPIANRMRKEVEGLIGFFINTLVLRTEIKDQERFDELLARVRKTALEAYAHQDIPFEQVVETLRPERHTSHTPLFQVMLALQNTPGSKPSLLGLELEAAGSESSTTRFDLHLNVVETERELACTLTYNIDLFEASTIARMAGHFVNLLDAVVADPLRRIADLPMLDATERKELLVQRNDTAVDYPHDKTIHRLFEEQVERTPEAPAIEFGQEQLSYTQLNARANRLAHYLAELGVGPDTCVAMCFERNIEMVVALLATLKAGGAYVPLDPAHPPERLSYMLADCEPMALLTQSSLVGYVTTGNLKTIVLDGLADMELVAKRSPANPRCDALTPRHLAYVIYTSGSTGAAKGVMVEHRSAVNFWQVMQNTTHRHCPETGRVALNSAYSFDMSLKGLLQVLSGRCLVVLPQDVRTNGEALLAFLATERIDAFECTPTQLELLLSAGLLDENGSHKPACILLGGEAINPGQWRKLKSVDSINFYNMYGPTEATVDATIGWLKELGDRPTIGRVIDNARIYLLDANRQPVPLGAVGEIYIGGIGVARGYLKRPELTAERFLDDCFTPGTDARMYKTGDLGRYLADGSIEYHGRNDHQVKIRGFRIELGEIEAKLGAHACVREAAVLAREDQPGDKRLVAYVVPETGHAIDAAELRSALASELADYMVPSAYVTLAALPLTVNGKLDRQALPVPDAEAYVNRGYEAPQGEIEIALAAIWQDLLGMEKIGRHDNFFELGGHSLMLVSLIQRMRQAGLQADVRVLFNTPTIAELAAAAGQGAVDTVVPANAIPADCTHITPAMLPLISLTQEEVDRVVEQVPGGAANIQDIYPLAPLQEGILFHHLMGKEGDAYLQNVLLAFDSRVRLDRFVEALQTVVDRHDILRTAILWEGVTDPLQVVLRSAALPIGEVLLDAAHDAGEQLRHRYDRSHYRIDVRRAPLMQGIIAEDKTNSRWLLKLLTHHLVLDHVTQEIVMREIHAILHGQAATLSAPLPFRNFVAKARTGVGLAEHEAFFREMLADVDEPSAPFGVIEVDGTQAMTQCRSELDPALSQRLRSCARRLGVTPASMMHLAWAKVLSAVSGRRDVVFGTVLFGRMDGGAGADRVLGLFINTLPLRINTGESGVEQAIRDTHARLANLSRHEHAPLAVAQRCSGVAAPMPLFSSLLNYRHGLSPDQDAAPVWEGVAVQDFSARTSFPLAVSVDDLGTVFILTVQACAGIREDLVHAMMLRSLESLTEAAETDPQAPLALLPVLPQVEHERILAHWNEAQESFLDLADCDLAVPLRAHSVVELFTDATRLNPLHAAIEWNGQIVSYGELDRTSNQAAHGLIAEGAVKGDVVALFLDNPIRQIVATLGALKAGCVFSSFNTAHPRQRLLDCMSLVTPRFVMSEPSCAARWQELADAATASPQVLLLDDNGLDALSESRPAVRLDADDPCYLYFTSGSTGKPKAVLGRTVGLAHFIQWEIGSFGIDERARISQLTNPAFDVYLRDVFAPLCAGATLCIPPPHTVLDPAALADWIEGSAVNLIHCVPTVFRNLLDADLDDGRFPALRHILLAGEALQPADANRWIAMFGERIRLTNLYGPTETSLAKFCYRLPAQLIEQAFVPVGRPIPGAQAILLKDNLEPCAPGEAGEVHIRTPYRSLGYWQAPELNQQAFISNPYSAGQEDVLYKTGDLAVLLEDGNFHLLGRKDFQVKIRGMRIELGDIEAALAAWPGLRDVAVLAREDVPGDKRLVAYVTARASSERPDVDALRAHLQQVLPDYMVPSHIVVLDHMPQTPNGKIDRKALPVPETTRNEVGYVAAQTEIERALAAIWAAVLKLDRVGVHDNFFELGGHSLLAVRLLERVRKLPYAISISLHELMANPTIAAIAAKSGAAGEKRDERALVTGVAPVLPNNYWFFERRDLNHWNASMLLKLKLPYEAETVRQAIAILLEHHDAMRAVWFNENGKWLQRFQQPAEMTPWWNQVDFSELPEHEVQAALEARCAATQTSLDITKVLFRATYFKLGNGRGARLMLTMHHLISDGSSKAILLNDLEQACAALEKDTVPVLPEKTSSIKETAEFIEDYSKTVGTKAELDYWKSRAWHRFRPLPKETDLESLLPDTGVAQPAAVFQSLSPEDTRRLERLPAGLPGISLEHILITAIALAYRSWSGAGVTYLNLVHHGRSWDDNPALDLSRTVGWLTNYSNILFDITASPTLADMVQTVKRQHEERKGKEVRFSLLRYQHPDEAVRETMAALPRHQLEFNFIPRQIAAQEAGELAAPDGLKVPAAFEPALENLGSNEGPMHCGFAPFSRGYFQNDCLNIYWIYCKTAHSAATFESFAAENIRAIKMLLDALEQEHDLLENRVDLVS